MFTMLGVNGIDYTTRIFNSDESKPEVTMHVLESTIDCISVSEKI